MAKFNQAFVNEFGFKTKTDFYEYTIRCGIAETVGTVKNRQDLFDPFFDNGRKGWWQKGDAYIHRKKFIDSLFSDYDVKSYADIVKLYLTKNFQIHDFKPAEASPIIKSKFKQLQLTGQEAELYFINHFREIEVFKDGSLEDARLFGDGYDFQIQIQKKFLLAEIKGLRSAHGSIRLTEKEFACADEYKDDYGIVIVSNLESLPKMTTIFSPTEKLALKKKTVIRQQISYHSKSLTW
ncbi:MAG: DUF3883 domain-containing protein [Acidobacteria bacterium]|jgi:hypothetical protein|nr:DUF3883 domain-containing protein [Acidobacteriota bacterium]